MHILFHRYGSIYEPDILSSFQSFGIQVAEDNEEITVKNISGSERIAHLVELILTRSPYFVFSINYFPYISDICEHYHIPYVCWTVDCPVLELFSSSISNSCNRIYLFDYEQYKRIAPQNPGHIYYLPLAANVDRWDRVLQNITEEDRKQYSSEVSFVGSLYNEKSLLSSMEIPEFEKGFIDGLVESQLQSYGFNFLEECITDELLQTVKNLSPSYPQIKDTFENIDSFIVAHNYLGIYATQIERIRTLNRIAKYADVTLYTRSDTSSMEKVHCKSGVSTHEAMPKIFALSKVNLNITTRTIQSGLSLRIWDVLGCGGFLLSNYQSEIPEYFEIGTDLDCYESPEDLDDKIQFYLKHEDIRQEIAHNGYLKVKEHHTISIRVAQILENILSGN